MKKIKVAHLLILNLVLIKNPIFLQPTKFRTIIYLKVRKFKYQQHNLLTVLILLLMYKTLLTRKLKRELSRNNKKLINWKNRIKNCNKLQKEVKLKTCCIKVCNMKIILAILMTWAIISRKIKSAFLKH